MTGKIIKLSTSGYGFISSIELPFTRIFFHWTALEQNTLHFSKLAKGMMVNFEVINFHDKGYRATHITVLRPQDITTELVTKDDV